MKLIKAKRIEKDATASLVDMGGRTAVVLSDGSLQTTEVETPAGMTAEAFYASL